MSIKRNTETNSYWSYFCFGRELETIFDAIDSRRKSAGQVAAAAAVASGGAASAMPDQAEIVRWLRGFQAIQGELNACVGCLEEGVAQIDVLNSKDGDQPTQKSPQKAPQEEDTEETEVRSLGFFRPFISFFATPWDL